MISQEQRDLVYEFCAAIYDDKEDAGIIAEAAVVRIENRMISFPELAQGILRRKGLRPRVRNLLQEKLQKWERLLAGERKGERKTVEGE